MGSRASKPVGEPATRLKRYVETDSECHMTPRSIEMREFLKDEPLISVSYSMYP
jgi:hypothetical protein